MENIYLYMLIALAFLAIADLIVGVSNDAVNFLNSAIGSKAISFRTIMIVASVGVAVGAIFSSGMMEVARKGIFNPGEFMFNEIMIIFMAVMITDILLLDFFNTLGLPTSTTVSIVFELLGAAVAMAALKIFSNGFPNYEETQEGLAVFSEYMSNNLTVKRLKELAYRVIAVNSLAKGYSFSETFRMFVNNYDLDRETAFNISVRAHRGGGFTKDYLYLTGLKKIYNYYKSGKDMKPLLRGKIALDYLENIDSLVKNGYAVDSKHITDSYMRNDNTNKTVDFILENLK